ncbi:uncharacterized protein LOC106649623 [Trichogramma pretiosum]|uniref:uncharacterized protein LOC106649623 n=1 Tax=Trichogramma pretiosum TaxID=7493 RepID=UPI0006C97A8D|nr:uncharacterized protein LOC106649623 [Trichogramma pretiosum]
MPAEAEVSSAESSSTSQQRVLNLKTVENTASFQEKKRKLVDESKYQCVVCQVNKNSLSELHWHQTYQHSTEELSLSVIGWKDIVKIVGPPAKEKEEKENSNKRSIWNSFSKKPSQFYYLSSSILGVQDKLQNKANLETPIDCSVTLTRVEEVIDLPVKAEKLITLVSKPTKIIKEEKEEYKQVTTKEKALNLHKYKEENNMSDPEDMIYEKWEKELNWMREISMEEFNKGARALCNELEDYKRLCALKKASKRKNVL